jgi:hypothetical protein
MSVIDADPPGLAEEGLATGANASAGVEMYAAALVALKINFSGRLEKQAFIKQYSPVKHTSGCQERRNIVFEIGGRPPLEIRNGSNIVACVFWQARIIGGSATRVDAAALAQKPDAAICSLLYDDVCWRISEAVERDNP